MPPPHELVLDEFCLRQFDDPTYQGTRINWNKSDFEKRVNEYYRAKIEVPDRDYPPLVDGYAPFCKHIFMPNWMPELTVQAIEITPENEHLMRSRYESRRPEELAVLTRWFPKERVKPPSAAFLDVILYSREQIEKENAAMPDAKGNKAKQTAPWGIISVKAQNEAYEIPMQPITMMRNSLGREEGGSGVPIDREAYRRSVEYWSKHAIVA